mgnify:CR=1 FL=1
MMYVLGMTTAWLGLLAVCGVIEMFMGGEG